MRFTTLLGAALTFSAAAEATVNTPKVLGQSADKKRPNFIFILTDDQDLYLDSLDYTPLTLKHLKQKGTFFKNHFVTTALCCPSRVSLWTGRQAHNTNVTDVFPPYGGYPKFVERGFNENFLPVWLQQAGYDTYYVGKLFNAHTVDNYNSPYVAGFNGSDFLLDPFTYSYLNSTYQRNRDTPVSYEGHYSVDVTANKSIGFLEDALAGQRPFFLVAAPIGPHSNVNPNLGTETIHGSLRMTAPIPADRHKDLFEGVKVPRTKHFNPDEPSGANWIRKLPKQNQTVVDYNDHFYRSRLRTLQSVDELVDGLITRLEESNQADNTYIIYTSDNGYHIGQHRLHPGKECGYEEDIRVPLFIRGPGVPEGREEDAVTTHVDLAPSIFELAGIPLREDFDGTPIPAVSESVSTRHEHVTVEYWGFAALEGEYGSFGPDHSSIVLNNTYKSVRVIGEGYNLYYSVWCNNEHELYDLETDPFQLHNLYPTSDAKDMNSAKILGRPIPQVFERLDAVLLVLKSCKGTTCIDPWVVLHPDGSVKNLGDSVQLRYDASYHSQPKVAFDRCELGYIVDAEGPQHPLLYRDGLRWDTWV